MWISDCMKDIYYSNNSKFSFLSVNILVLALVGPRNQVPLHMSIRNMIMDDDDDVRFMPGPFNADRTPSLPRRDVMEEHWIFVFGGRWNTCKSGWGAPSFLLNLFRSMLCVSVWLSRSSLLTSSTTVYLLEHEEPFARWWRSYRTYWFCLHALQVALWARE